MKEPSNDLTIRQIQSAAVESIKSSWPEQCFIVILGAGVQAFAYACLVFICMLAGEHHDFYAVLCFDGSPQIMAVKALFLLIMYLGSIPLYFGIRWFYWQMSAGMVMPLSSLFACYSSKKMVKRCIDIKVHTDLHLLIRVGAAAAAIFGIVDLFGLSDETKYSLKNSVGVFLVFLVLVVMFLSTIDLVFVPYVFAENNDLSAQDILAKSKELVRRDMSFSVRLYFSYLPWYIFAVFIFPLLIVIPFMNVMMACYMRKLISSDGEQIPDAAAVHGAESGT